MKLSVKKTFTIEMSEEEAKSISIALELLKGVTNNLFDMKELMQNSELNVAKQAHILKDVVGDLSVLKAFLS